MLPIVLMNDQLNDPIDTEVLIISMVDKDISGKDPIDGNSSVKGLGIKG